MSSDEKKKKQSNRASAPKAPESSRGAEIVGVAGVETPPRRIIVPESSDREGTSGEIREIARQIAEEGKEVVYYLDSDVAPATRSVPMTDQQRDLLRSEVRLVVEKSHAAARKRRESSSG